MADKDKVRIRSNQISTRWLPQDVTLDISNVITETGLWRINIENSIGLIPGIHRWKQQIDSTGGNTAMDEATANYFMDGTNIDILRVS